MQGERTRSESPLNHRAVFGVRGGSYRFILTKLGITKPEKRQVQTLNVKSIMEDFERDTAYVTINVM